jgi:aromatic-L-amino-acid decarboxylase
MAEKPRERQTPAASRETTAIGDMAPEEFRYFGRRLVDWTAHYLGSMERYPVLAKVRPGQIRKRLPPAGPEEPESMEQILADLESIVVPGITHWNHPGFFSYFSITGSGPGILGELLSAAFNVNGMLWKTSPAATELEEAVIDWLRQWLGLPAEFWGIIYDTASTSTFHALAAAREAVPGTHCREEGLAGGPRLRLYTSEQAHSSVEKAAIALGVGLRGVRKIPVDDEFRLRPEKLEAAIREDLAAGRTPFAVVATVGTTSTTSVDPVPAVADLCRDYDLWLHVDAAYAGPAAILPEKRWVLEGCERADSLVTNPHKWLFTPIDASVLFCRRPEVLRQAFSLVPDYLKTDEAATNFMDYGIQLGRRFRALKLWMVMRYFGRRGVEARLREHLRLAAEFARWVDEHPDFERLAPTPFSTVCFRACPARLRAESGAAVVPGRAASRPHPDPGERLDGLNEQLLERVNGTGEVFLSSTRLHGRLVLRLAVGNLKTTEQHVRRAWELLCRELHSILAAP